MTEVRGKESHRTALGLLLPSVDQLATRGDGEGLMPHCSYSLEVKDAERNWKALKNDLIRSSF